MRSKPSASHAWMITMFLSSLISIFFVTPQDLLAQTWKPRNATKLQLPSNASDPSKTITIQAPTLASSSTLVLPPANTSGALVNDGSGNLSWSGSTILYTSSTTEETTTSTTDVAISSGGSVTVTSAGDYLIMFNANIKNSNANRNESVQIYAPNAIPASVRTVENNASNVSGSITSMVYATGLQVNDVIQVKWHTSASTGKLEERTLIAYKIK